ncbi:MAG: hypothetical protein KAX09_01205 [Candidatus Heimdallarchaeota archaeon]|nr:hypothetical protein [Candidatus Heimdallarchaeota archaeon]MCK4289576.1 hypothetical protein [Candidatus Heimdallarchaeota archaeon]
MKTPLEYSGRSSSDPEALAIGRSHELTDLITHFAKQQPVSEFYNWFKELTILDQNFPNSKEIQENFAKAIKNATKMFGERKAFADLLYLLDDLKKLKKRCHPNEIITEFLAEAYSNAIYYLRGSWDVEGTAKLLREFRDLIRETKNNKKALILYAKSYSNAITRFCSNKQNFACDKLLFEFRLLANKNKDNPEIQAEFAQALISVLSNFAREYRHEELNQVLEEITKIARRFPDNEKIQLLLTRATILSSLTPSRNE